MNDIQKLHNVIDALEEQSARVSEFNGVLSALNLAKEEVTAVKIVFNKLAEEQKNNTAISNNKLEVYGEKLVALQTKIALLESNQQRLLDKLSSLSFLTPEKFEQGRIATEKVFIEQVMQHSAKVDGVIADQVRAIRSLRTVVVIGFFVLVGCIVSLSLWA